MAIEPSEDAKNTENNSSGHPNQNDSSDSDLSNIDDGDNSEDEDDSANTKSSYNVNDLQRLALACDDGSVRLYNVPESGALTYYRSLPRVSGMSCINSVFRYLAINSALAVTFVHPSRADSERDVE